MIYEKVQETIMKFDTLLSKYQYESEVNIEVTGVITVSYCGVFLLLLLIIFVKSRTRYYEIDEKYGKPYMAKLVKMIGGHPKIKSGSMAISLHPKNAIAFNCKVFHFSQITSIKIISQLPTKLNDGRKTAVNSEAVEQFLCIAIKDEYGEHEVIFTAKANFIEIANKLIRKWNMYNLLN